MPGSGDFQVIYQQILRQNQAMAEQNTRLMEMMERFGNQENVSIGRRAARSSSSSSGVRVREFVYDPDNGLVFDRWYRKYEDLFLKDGAKLDDAAKVRLLLRSLSVTVHDKYVNFVLPKHPMPTSANLKHDTAIVEHKKSVSTICAVKQNKPPSMTPSSKEKEKTKSEGPKTPCWQCGGMHYVRDCTYTKHVCRDCKQTGHKEGYCGSYTSKAALKKKKHVNGIFSINQVSCTSRRKFLTVDINGSQVTNNSINLIGLEWIELFKLWDTPLSTICNQVHVADGQVKQIQVYKAAYPEVFKNGLGRCKKMKVRLYLKPDAKPVFKPKRPVPFTSMEKIDAELDRLQSLGIITPVDFSQWAAPIVVVKKPGGKLYGCRYFSVIDLSDAYLQVEVDDSKQLLTINTHRGLFRFNRLAPGVKSAPGAFQQLMNSMVADLEGVDTFLDDIFVASKTEEEHHKMLKALFQRRQAYGFVLREEKCNILQTEVKYLAHIVDENGLRPDPSKVEAIVKMPPPKDVTTLRSFLGAVNFYAKFVPEMHQLRRPLDALLKNAKFVWNSECQKSFRRFKEVLQSDLLLTHYDPSLAIIVAADASQSGIGACLLHRFPDGSLKSIEKEGLALVFAVTKFHRMLLGRKFTLQTDHQPLLRIFGQKKGIPVHTANRLQRWALTLLCYNFDIEYVSTTQVGYADVLSRLINGYVKAEEDFIIASIQLEDDIDIPLQEAISSLPVTFKAVRGATLQCPVLQQVIQYNQRGWPSKIDDIANAEVRPFFAHRDALSVVNGCVMMSNRLVIPDSFRQRILKQLDRGHPGMKRMKAIARSHVYWPRIDDHIADFVKRCESSVENYYYY
ncbi:uncharacterized protein K02A2.6-like [Armigeres subalbatus]|uniref:uncharacterized protein K02A2.6-like n=1 Tax=Armigeres subalbatus TaxID=124917 RepID=UPI002ED64520